MNVNRYLIASLAVFVSAVVLDYVINGVILKDAYEATKSVWRPDMASKTWIFFLIDLIYAFPFTYIFVRGYEGKGIIEGARFGAIVGVLISVPMAYGLYALVASALLARATVVPLRIHRGRFARTSGSCCVPTEEQLTFHNPHMSGYDIVLRYREEKGNAT